MPEISRFLGIRIFMFYEEHAPPHVHARYAGQSVVLNLESLAVVKGEFPGRALGLVVEWGRDHREELRANWDRARQSEPLLPIRPLG